MTNPSAKSRTGGQLLVDTLAVNGLTTAFGVPGESFLAVLDAMYRGPVEFVMCRQEGGAAMMAEAAGKLTGRPGVCFVTRGPGATNASAGVHVAQQDSTPMLLFVGNVPRRFRGREAFQEIDVEAVFAPLAKWAVEIRDTARVSEIVSRAIEVALHGRPGPVVISLPEDILTETAAVPDLPRIEVAEIAPRTDELSRFEAMLRKAERPIAILGGSRWSAEAVADFERFAARLQLPVAPTFRRQMLFSADHECYAGELGRGVNPRLVDRVRTSDLVLLLGGRLGETASQGYTLLGVPNPGLPLVHVHPGESELGRVYQPALAIHASPIAFIAALSGIDAPANSARRKWREDARAEYIGWSEKIPSNPGSVQMGTIIRYLRERLPADTIVSNGAGNYSTWVHRFHRHRGYGTQLGPIAGSMGYGVPAALAAKRLAPARTVVAFAGDGDFQMTEQELATAVQHDLAIRILIIDNGIHGTIRMYQEGRYPGRVVGTTLRNPDFAAMARAFGAEGYSVTRDEETIPALDRAFAARGPAVVHVKLDPEAITPTATLAEIRARAQQSQIAK